MAKGCRTSGNSLSLTANIQATPRAAWVLFLGCFINQFGSFVVPFLVLYLTHAGFAPTIAGMAVGIYGLGQMCASVVGGYLSDRIGARRTILVSMLLSAMAAMALSMAKGLVLIALLVFGLGVGAELYFPASAALIANLVAPPQRVTTYALYRLALNAGFAAGPATAGVLADRSYFWLFLGDALSSLAFFGIALFALPTDDGQKPMSEAPSDDPPESGERAEQAKTAWALSIAHDRAFMRFIAASLVLSLVFFQYRAIFPLYVRDLGFSNAMYGALVSINGVMVVLLEVPATSFTQRLPARTVIAVGVLVAGIGFALTGTARGVPMLAITVIIWSLGEILVAPVTSALVADLAPTHLRGRYMGVYGFFSSLGMTLGPAMGTWLYARDAIAPWAACGVLSVISAALIIRHGTRAKGVP